MNAEEQSRFKALRSLADTRGLAIVSFVDERERLLKAMAALEAESAEWKELAETRRTELELMRTRAQRSASTLTRDVPYWDDRWGDWARDALAILRGDE